MTSTVLIIYYFHPALLYVDCLAICLHLKQLPELVDVWLSSIGNVFVSES